MELDDDKGVALRCLIGRADLFELLSRVFAFPDEGLTQALVDGSLAVDVRSCLLDAGSTESQTARVADGLHRWENAELADLLAVMRRTYSHLYLAPGGSTPVFPYESAFLHVERGLGGAPALFCTPVTLDVERQMHEAGVAAKNERREPCDSVFEECEFLSYLYARRAHAVTRDAHDEATEFGSRIACFLDDHALTWLPLFAERTCSLDAEGPYGSLANILTATCNLVAEDAAAHNSN